MLAIAPGAENESDPSDFTPLTAAQVQALREKAPSVSPWWVVGGQVVVGVLVALIAWAVSGRASVGWSAAYGAAAVVIPAALFARGVTGQFASANPATAVLAFFVWEFVKIVVTIGVLYAAHRMAKDLSWPAMLVGLVVTMKVYWLALARKRNTERNA